MPKKNIPEATQAPVKPQTPTRPAPVKPRPEKPQKPAPFNPPRPAKDPSPKNFDAQLDEVLGIEAPAAPTKPATPVKPTTPSRPQRPQKREPFKPPRPAVLPKPKNDVFDPPKPSHIPQMEEHHLEQVIISEAYEDEAHPSTQQFWSGLPSNKEHLFGKHPILALYGNDLSRAAYDHAKAKADESGADQHATMRAMHAIMQIERRHQKELVDLAKRITIQIWNIPEEMLRGQLTGDVEHNVESSDEAGPIDSEEGHEVDPRIRKEINKRVTMNMVTQGSAVHAMLTMHHAIDKEINAIDPQLLQLYNQISSGSLHWYWLIDIPGTFASLAGMAVGSESIKWEQADMPADPNEERGEVPVVDARALIFPILAQEMNKGVAELLSLHGLSGMDEGMTRSVLAHADDMRHEPYLIQVGPELWRRFLKVRPRDVPLAEIVQALAMLDPDELHKVVAAVVEDPEHAKEILENLVSMNEEPDEFESEDPESPEWEEEGYEGEWNQGYEDDQDEDWDKGW